MPETSDPDCSGQAGIGAVLLAAGESTRMGRPKQLLEWAGRPLVQYQVQELQATSAQEIVVVLGHEADLLEPLVEQVMKSPRTHAVINPDYRQGKTTSIKTGLRNPPTAVGGVMLLLSGAIVLYDLLSGGDMAAAVRLGMAHLASTVGPKPLHIVGMTGQSSARTT